MDILEDIGRLEKYPLDIEPMVEIYTNENRRNI